MCISSSRSAAWYSRHVTEHPAGVSPAASGWAYQEQSHGSKTTDTVDSERESSARARDRKVWTSSLLALRDDVRLAQLQLPPV